MAFLDRFKKQEESRYIDQDFVAIANGEMVPPSEINDAIFAEEIMGKTIGFKLTDGHIVSPVNGKVEMIFQTGHAFAVRMADGTGVLVHIGINTVELNGKGFKTFVKEGTTVNAGQKMVEVDLDTIKAAELDSITMLIISEPVKDNYEYIDFGSVTQGQIINK
jgi:glucose-specific phosphotransferase system IIA component